MPPTQSTSLSAPASDLVSLPDPFTPHLLAPGACGQFHPIYLLHTYISLADSMVGYMLLMKKNTTAAFNRVVDYLDD